MIERLGRSLSFRLLAIFLVMGCLFAYGAVLGIRWVYLTDDLRELVNGHLSLHVRYVRRDIGSPPSVENALEITRQVPVDIRLVGPSLNWASDDAFPQLDELEFGGSDIFSEQAENWLRDLDNVQFATSDGHSYLRIDQGAYAIVVASPKIAERASTRELTPIIMGFGLFLVLLAYLAVRWLFKPIGAIRRGASEIGNGNFQHRIVDVRRDQLGDLADDINRMAHDVEQMLNAKRQLLFGISHELRSPLSRMKLALELSNDPNAVEEFGGDVEEMEKIISTLLEAERLNSRHAAINVVRVGARDLLAGMVDDYFARDRRRIVIDVSPDTYLNVDEARLTLLLKNLISNALRYSAPDDGPVVVRVEETADAWIVSVADHGPGIPDEQKPYVGEAFFRGDPSRTRQTGGSGLGLYLSRLVAEAHGGRLELDETYTEGARFVVTLPFELAPGSAVVPADVAHP
ncbi:MAG: HAMP domain-containing sensor histidine kinase [Pseudomonadota bacterium]